jgi:hypothetical protein
MKLKTNALQTMKLHRINSKRFSLTLCNVAENYGFKTIGSMYKAVKQASPNIKWQVTGSAIEHVRGSKLLREIEAYLS